MASSDNITSTTADITYSLSLNGESSAMLGLYQDGTTIIEGTFTEDVESAIYNAIDLTPETSYQVKLNGIDVIHEFTTEIATLIPAFAEITIFQPYATGCDMALKSFKMNDDTTAHILIRDEDDTVTIQSMPQTIDIDNQDEELNLHTSSSFDNNTTYLVKLHSPLNEEINGGTIDLGQFTTTE